MRQTVQAVISIALLGLAGAAPPLRAIGLQDINLTVFAGETVEIDYHAFTTVTSPDLPGCVSFLRIAAPIDSTIGPMTIIACTPDPIFGSINASPCTYESPLGTLTDTAGIHSGSCSLTHSPSTLSAKFNMQKSSFSAASSAPEGTITFQVQAVEQNTELFSNVATVSIQVEASVQRSPQLILMSMRAHLLTAAREGNLHHGLRDALESQIVSILRSLADSNTTAALQQSDALRNHIQANSGNGVDPTLEILLMLDLDELATAIRNDPDPCQDCPPPNTATGAFITSFMREFTFPTRPPITGTIKVCVYERVSFFEYCTVGTRIRIDRDVHDSGPEDDGLDPPEPKIDAYDAVIDPALAVGLQGRKVAELYGIAKLIRVRNCHEAQFIQYRKFQLLRYALAEDKTVDESPNPRGWLLDIAVPYPGSVQGPDGTGILQDNPGITERVRSQIVSTIGDDANFYFGDKLTLITEFETYVVCDCRVIGYVSWNTTIIFEKLDIGIVLTSVTHGNPEFKATPTGANAAQVATDVKKIPGCK